MAACYKRLFKLLIDKDMRKADLERKAELSHYTINKLNKGQTLNTDTLEKICRALDCTLDDIMEFIPDKEES